MKSKTKSPILPILASMSREKMEALEERTNYLWKKIASVLIEENATNQDVGLIGSRLLVFAAQDSCMTLEQILHLIRLTWKLNSDTADEGAS